nr:MAG TPA_asm: hypothetical protein [Caudoviricetes sp.]
MILWHSQILPTVFRPFNGEHPFSTATISIAYIARK